MIIQLDSKTGSSYIIGIQTNIGKVSRCALWKILQWAPKRAKSFQIIRFQHTDYSGNISPNETGYATVEVEYYTKEKEGNSIPLSSIPCEYPN